MAATPLSLVELEAVLSESEGPRRVTEVRRRVDSYENLADSSHSARPPPNLLKAQPYVFVKEAVAPHNAHVVTSERVAKRCVLASHGATVARIHAKVLSYSWRSCSERTWRSSGDSAPGTCLSVRCAPASVSQGA